MRVALLALGCLLFQTTGAQQENTVSPQIMTDTLPRPVNVLAGINEPQARLLNTLPDGNKVYALPQDNMPCVVPAATPTMPWQDNNRPVCLITICR